MTTKYFWVFLTLVYRAEQCFFTKLNTLAVYKAEYSVVNKDEVCLFTKLNSIFVNKAEQCVYKVEHCGCLQS